MGEFLQIYASQRLLVANGVATQSIGCYIVDILNENHIRLDVVEVRKQRSVTRRAEQKLTLVGEEWSVVRIHCDSVGRRLLLRERDVVADAELRLVVCYTLVEQSLECSLARSRLR